MGGGSVIASLLPLPGARLRVRVEFWNLEKENEKGRGRGRRGAVVPKGKGLCACSIRGTTATDATLPCPSANVATGKHSKQKATGFCHNNHRKGCEMATTSEKSKSTASASPPWTSLMHATAAGTALGASTGLAAGLAGASADWLTKRKRPTLRVLRPARTTGALAFTCDISSRDTVRRFDGQISMYAHWNTTSHSRQPKPGTRQHFV